MTTINTVFLVFLCIFAVIGAGVMLLFLLYIIALIIGGIMNCGFNAKAKKKSENNCPYKVEGEKQND